MERITRRRALILIIILAVIISFYAFHLYDVQIIETGGVQQENITTFTTWTRVRAARGEILDRNGNILVGNRAGYNLVINHYVLLSADGTYQHLYNLTQRCLEQGITYNESFPVSKERPFTYLLDQQNSTQQTYFQRFLQASGNMDSDISAPLLIEKLRSRYKLPQEWTDEEARLVIGLAYELSLRNIVEILPQYEFMTDVGDAELASVVELNIPGLNVEPTSVREYYTDYAAHILGYVGAMSPAQWEKYKDVDGYEMDSLVGRDGLEAAFEEYLHGVDGLREDKVAKDGTLISSRWLTEPKAGNNVELTIDINLQRVAEEKLAEMAATLQAQEEGKDGADVEGLAAVALDPRTGEVLVCASYPTYDPSTFFQDYDELIKDPLLPTFNRALQGIYPPGSTYKMSSIIAAINSHTVVDSVVVDSFTVIEDKGEFTKYTAMDPTFKPSCLQYSSYGTVHKNVTAARALKYSCNYYFYVIGDNMRLADMDATAKGLGLGEKTGVELYEAQGYRANQETKRMLYKGDDAIWSDGDRVVSAIGQADNRFTPIQLAVYAGALANNGTRYKATFMSRVVSADYRTLVEENSPEVASVLEISQDAHNAYLEGMILVTHESGGTAYSTFADYPIQVAAKTGTPQHDKRHKSDHGAFVCFAPARSPEIAIAIYGEHAGHGSSLAVVARAMLDEHFKVGDVADVQTYENQLS